MSKKIYLISVFITLVSNNLIFSQHEVFPGAVKEPSFWIKSRNNAGSYYWEHLTKKEGKISKEKQAGASFNFNPSIIFDGEQDSLILPLGTISKRRNTVFLVYKAQDSLKEQFLWTIADAHKTLSVATNKRLVDLSKYYYQSYQEKIKPQKANIHFFQQNVTDSVPRLLSLTIGQKSKFDKLPPEEFKGKISEILLYDRVLSSQEVQKIASYLAIKYGISLSQYDFKNYLNSKGDIIWNYTKHQGFEYSITGIGRDDASSLLQRKSSNMAEEGLLTMELKSNTSLIPDNYFSFWSDNGKNLLVKKQLQGEPIGVSREWQLDYSNPTDLSLDWSFNPNYIKGSLPNDQYYWLLVDHSGKGTYDEKDSEYVRLGSSSSKEKLVLTDFNWDKQKTGKTKFTIKIAPAMFSRVKITDAICGVSGSGQLQYSIEGGEAPFTVTVIKAGTNIVVKQWNQAARSTTGVQLASGSYDYIVRDAKGNLYSETVFVADKQGTFPNLKSDYLLINGNQLVLDASVGLPEGNYEYQWYYEGDFIDNTAKITIDQAGVYELRLFNEHECKTASKINVTTDGKDGPNSQVVILYPNPTADGHFALAMEFPHKTNATITINSPTAALLQQKQLTQIDTYVHEDVIKGPSGLYLVTVNSEFGTKTFKVILK